MVYSKGNRMIAVEYEPIMGKRPQLIIGTGRPATMEKVASFGSPEKAARFEEWLREFFGEMLVDNDEEKKK